MKLVFGLGNPGPTYADTYHNVGFAAADMLAERNGAGAFSDKKDALVCDCVIAGEKVLLIKPLTYMNLSGDAVAHYAHYYKVEPEDILVVYDDIDIPKGTVRARESGSAGTHNGMRDIVAKLGSTAFARVRIGTGIKPSYMDLKDYVLMHIPAPERAGFEKAYAAACEFVESWVKGEKWETLTVTLS